MRSNLFDDGDDDSPQNEGQVELEIDKEYRRRSENNRQRDDLNRYEAQVKIGQIVEDDHDEDEEDEEESESDEEIGVHDVGVWMESLVKLKERDPKFVEEDISRSRVQTYDEEQEELRQAFRDDVEAGGNESGDDEDLLKVKVGDDDLKEIADEYFGKETELNEGDRFLRDYLLKQLWKEKDGKGKMEMIDEAEIEHIEEDEDLVDMQEEYETQYRHEENAREVVMGQSRVVAGSVRKKDNARKTQRKNKEDNAEIERRAEVKRLKNFKQTKPATPIADEEGEAETRKL